MPPTPAKGAPFTSPLSDTGSPPGAIVKSRQEEDWHWQAPARPGPSLSGPNLNAAGTQAGTDSGWHIIQVTLQRHLTQLGP